jgi:hypothetical protein
LLARKDTTILAPLEKLAGKSNMGRSNASLYVPPCISGLQFFYCLLRDAPAYSLEEYIEYRYKRNGQEGRGQHAAENDRPDGALAGGPGPECDQQGHDTHDEGRRSHHDRPETAAGGFDGP